MVGSKVNTAMPLSEPVRILVPDTHSYRGHVGVRGHNVHGTSQVDIFVANYAGT